MHIVFCCGLQNLFKLTRKSISILFVFLVTFLINLLFAYFAENPLLFVNFAFLGNKVLQPVYTALLESFQTARFLWGLQLCILKAQSALLPAFQGFVPGAGLGDFGIN